MQVSWAEEMTRSFETVIEVLVSNGMGVLAHIAQAVSSADADITHIDMGPERARHTAELKMTVAVRDRLQLADVLRAIKRAPSVLRVHRAKH
jgi:GTP diphosphokinase / guanosine-3',5'-bis(diphosphate) 3'-diphosphatase